MSSNKQAKKAHNPLNQPIIDRFHQMSQEPRYSSSTHFPRAFRKAIDSLSKCPLQVTTYEDAMKLDGVGKFFASKIATFNSTATGDAVSATATTSKKKRNAPSQEKTPKNKRKTKVGNVPKCNNDDSADQDLPTTCAHSQGQGTGDDCSGGNAKLGTRRRNTPSRDDANILLKRCNSQTGSSQPTSGAGEPSQKETAFQLATREAERVCGQHLDEYVDWNVVLLLDQRERKGDKVQAKLLQAGISCEQRTLPIGDMVWIARGTKRRPGPMNAATNTGEAIEVVLGTIIERKTAVDLASSLYGTRFDEQRLRLRDSAAGASQVIYLVEASSLNEVPSCPGSTLRYAMMNTMVQLGFAVIRTRHLDDTVKCLRRIHRRLTKRAFPRECESGMPFHSPDGRRRPAPEEQTFRLPPEVPFDQARHSSYAEFKTKLELARERGTRSVESIFRAQLKQVESMSVKKVTAVTRVYRTPKELSSAYGRCLNAGGGAAEKLVENISLGSGERNSRVGPKSSLELSYVYTEGGTSGLYSNPGRRVCSNDNISADATNSGSVFRVEGAVSGTSQDKEAFSAKIVRKGLPQHHQLNVRDIGNSRNCFKSAKSSDEDGDAESYASAAHAQLDAPTQDCSDDDTNSLARLKSWKENNGYRKPLSECSDLCGGHQSRKCVAYSFDKKDEPIGNYNAKTRTICSQLSEQSHDSDKDDQGSRGKKVAIAGGDASTSIEIIEIE